MNRCIASLFILIALTGICHAQGFEVDGIFKEAANVGKISQVISNIGFAQNTERYIDSLVKNMVNYGIGFKNLILINTDRRKPAFLALYLAKENKIFYFDSLGKKMVNDFSFESLVQKPHYWNKKIKEKFLNGNEYTLISTVFFLDLLPYRMTRAVEFHDHICPGLIIGYFISKLLLEKIKEDEKLYVFTFSPFCKDDALQILLNSTVDKRLLFARNLTKEEKELFSNTVGLYILWNEQKNLGRGFLIEFNFNDLKKEAEIGDEEYPWLQRLKIIRWMLKNQDSVMRNIKIQKEINVDHQTLESLKTFEIALTDLQ